MNVDYITVKQFKELSASQQKLLVIDVREPEEYNAEHISGARNIPEQKFEQLDYGDMKIVCEIRRYVYAGYTIVLCCERGNASMICARKLNSYGVYAKSLYGGTKDYFK